MKYGYEITDGVFKRYHGIDRDVVIPDGVTRIGEEAFMDCTKLNSVIIPGSVTIIEDRAFCGCKNMTSIVIGYGVRVIGEGAFIHCESLPPSVSRAVSERSGTERSFAARV